MTILDGREVAKAVRAEAARKVEQFKKTYKKAPQLAVISVGDDPASKIYLRNKEKACEEVGIQFLRHELDKDNHPEALDNLITHLNADADVNGILVQLPMPPAFKIERVLEVLNPEKDADGFHPENLGLLMTGRPRVKPCTPFGIMKILEHYKINPAGKTAVVVGRSTIVGKPMGQLLLAADATVIQCHSKTKNLAEWTRQGDIVVVAAGKRHLLDASAFKKDAVVIDVGMHHLDDKKITGDVNTATLDGKVAAYTPVPGGVGPMTVAMLVQNTVDLAFSQQGHRII